MDIEKINNQTYNVALYMRLSKEDGDKEESESISNQRKILSAFIKENSNFKFVDEYVDDGYSGTNFNRPDFQRMLQDIENKKINMVITKNLARLGRDYIDTGKFIEKYFPENNVRYISVLDDVDTTLDKNCDTAAIKNIMNDFYARETSRNIKKTKNRKKKEGFYYISVAPFGYQKIDKSGKIEIIPSQAEIVKRIYELFLNGHGTYQISKILNEENILTPGLQMEMTNVRNNKTAITDKWRHTTIKRILTNPVYIGNCVQNKTRKISYKSKKIITLPIEEQTIMENHHEGIIDKNTFDMVQKMFKNMKGSKRSEFDPLLKSLLYCTHCHNRLMIIKKNDKYKDKITVRKYIVCETANRKISNQKCYKQYINYDNLEKIILDKISDIIEQFLNSEVFNDRKALENLIENNTTINKIYDKKNLIENELNVINKKIKTLYMDRLNEVIEEQDYVMFSDTLLSKRNQLQEEKKEIESEINNFDNATMGDNMREEMRDVLKKITRKKDYSKEILQQLVNKIEIDKDKNILIHFNFFELNFFGGAINGKKAIS